MKPREKRLTLNSVWQTLIADKETHLFPKPMSGSLPFAIAYGSVKIIAEGLQMPSLTCVQV